MHTHTNTRIDSYALTEHITEKSLNGKKDKGKKRHEHTHCFGGVWFYGISTIVGYLMPNPVFMYISNI